MRSVGHWHGVFRAWAALVLAVGHLLLMLSTNVTQAASFSIASSLDGTVCLPGGGGGSLDVPGQPTHDHRDDCCILCAALGPIAAVPSASDAAPIYPIIAGPADNAYAAPFLGHLFDRLSGSPRAPPRII